MPSMRLYFFLEIIKCIMTKIFYGTHLTGIRHHRVETYGKAATKSTKNGITPTANPCLGRNIANKILRNGMIGLFQTLVEY